MSSFSRGVGTFRVAPLEFSQGRSHAISRLWVPLEFLLGDSLGSEQLPIGSIVVPFWDYLIGS